MKLPFGYDLRISKRGIKFLEKGQLLNFVDWQNGITFNTSTPIMEEVYSTIASEFAKIDLRHIVKNKNGFEFRTDELDFLLSDRPNPLQTKYDLLYTLAYQREKYGNALAIVLRDDKGFVKRIDPINCQDYMFGCGYVISDGKDKKQTLLKFKNLKTGAIELVDYNNLIHLRKNPNDLFYGDLFNGFNNNKAFIELIDSGLSSLISELQNNGTLRGVVQVGSSATGLANRMLADNESKVSKQQEIINRIKATKGGVLVLDAGEEWKSLSSPFETTSTKDIDKYIDLLLQFNGINKKVVEGTASEEEMQVFFNKSIMPLIEQFVSEMNYKLFSQTARTQGHRVEYYRNPFEYVSITKAIDVAYKSIQDTTTNERRAMIYKLPPIKDGDRLMLNKNFEGINDDNSKEVNEDGK